MRIELPGGRRDVDPSLGSRPGLEGRHRMSPDDDLDIAPLSPEEEAVMDEELEAALAAYEGVAPPELLALMRETAREAGRTHPAARRLLAAAAARPVVFESGDMPRFRVDDGKVGGQGGA
jgi:hypothetical protein